MAKTPNAILFGNPQVRGHKPNKRELLEYLLWLENQIGSGGGGGGADYSDDIAFLSSELQRLDEAFGVNGLAASIQALANSTAAEDADIRGDFAAADAAISQALTTETSARQSAVSALLADNTDIRGDFAAGDLSLAQSITTEVAAREFADDALGVRTQGNYDRILKTLGINSFSAEEHSPVYIDCVHYSVVLAYADGYLIGGVDDDGRMTSFMGKSSVLRDEGTVTANGKTYASVLATKDGGLLGGLNSSGEIDFLVPVNRPNERVETVADPDWDAVFAYQDGKIAMGFPSSGGPAYVQGWYAQTAWTTVSHLIGLGQSNEQAFESVPVVTTSDQGFGGLRFQTGVWTYEGTAHPADPQNRPASGFTFKDLFEEYDQGVGETPNSGLVAQLKYRLSGGRLAAGDMKNSAPRFLASFPHRGGKHLAELDWRDWETNPVNPNPGPGGYHATFLDDIRRAKASAAAQGWSYGVAAFTFTQGENEGGGQRLPGMGVETWATFVPAYKADLAEAYRRWDLDARAITGQTRPIPLFIKQVLNDFAGVSQMQLANEHPDIFMVGPIYHVPSARNSLMPGGARPSNTHEAADGKRWHGEMTGKVAHRVAEGEDWRPLQPSDVWRVSDTEIMIRFDVPRMPLRFDTEWLPKAANQGFGVWLGSKDTLGAARTIAAVEIVHPDCVKLTLAAGTPVVASAAAIVRYGHSAVVGNTTAVIASVRAGAAYASGQASTEVVFTGDILAQFTPMLAEGCFILRQYSGTNPWLVVRDARVEGGNTIARGETREYLNQGFAVGSPSTIERDRPFGNLADSDRAVSVFTFADPAYGTRQGKRYPLHNNCLVFTQAVRT